jgi:hypothetical protein
MAMVAVSLCMLHGPHASVPQSFEPSANTSIWQLTTGPDAVGTATVPAAQLVVRSRQQTGAQTEEDAEYRAERRACESLTSDARNHCLEYAKLRYRH